MRPGGYQRWSEVFPDEPDSWTHGRIDLTDVVDGELLDGVMHITGHLPGGFQPFETRMRVEFYDEADGRTRLEIRQWLPEDLRVPQRGGLGRGARRAGRPARRARRPMTDLRWEGDELGEGIADAGPFVRRRCRIGRGDAPAEVGHRHTRGSSPAAPAAGL